MNTFITVLVIAAVVALIVLVLAVRIVKQYEGGVLFRLGKGHRLPRAWHHGRPALSRTGK
jgi:regulator of protease activity HflC (stomatin/prohibitin superfamily)